MINGICRQCSRRDTIVSRPTRNQRQEGQPFFWSDENALDPGTVPNFLPKLTQVEEMLIA